MIISGAVHKIDKLGRVVISRSIREILKIKTNDLFEVYVSKGNVMIKKFSFADFSDLDAIIKEENYISGAIHPVDNLGRIVIPACLREMFGFNSGVKCELYLEDGIIVAKKFE